MGYVRRPRSCIFFILLVICINNSVCQADTFVVPLDVSGTCYTNEPGKSFSIDLGTALSEVHSVSISCDGSITAGVDYYGAPFSWDFLAYLDSESLFPFTILVARGGASTYPDPEPFSTQNSFGTADWDFLLDGKASGFLQPLGMGVLVGYEPQAMPEFTINSASLIIDAEPVPEPTMFLLLGFGAMLLRKKK